MKAKPILKRDDRFQLLEALVHNRNRRTREQRFVVQGVRPLSLAVQKGWTLQTLLYAHDTELSDWARGMVDFAKSAVAVNPRLLGELAEKESETVELVGIVEMPDDSLDRLLVTDSFCGVVFDRPTQPGNIGTMLRSLDALGGSGLIVSGHAADVYDPKSVRASTGSLFSLPSVRVPSPTEVLDWVQATRASGVPIQTVATDEAGDTAVWDVDLTRPTLLLVGNETTGLSHVWRNAADVTASIPMSGSASSLNAATAGSLILYEAMRQRHS